MSSNSYEEIDRQLTERSQVAFDPETGNMKRQEAWERIDELLDMRNDLGRLILATAEVRYEA